MSLVLRRNNRALFFAAVVAFLLILHVLYSGPSIPQWKTPSFLSSETSKSENYANQLPEGVPLRIYSEPGSAPSEAPEPEHETSAEPLSTSVPFWTTTATSTATWTTSISTELTSSSLATSSPTHQLHSPSSKAPNPTYPALTTPQNNTHVANNKTVDSLPCKSLPGGEDVLVVMRTGATEIRDKLTMHLNTTLQCYPNIVIFSDYEETFGGHQIHDALKYTDEEIKNSNPDFEHYRHLQEVGRAGLDQSELSGKLSVESGPNGKTDNAGWKLDKWKFLPMANMTYSLYPNMKWYVFVEPDTYLVWSNLLQWIPKLDPSKPLYAGSEAMIGDDIFAHGGSAFLLSQPALESGARFYQAKTKELNDFTSIHWAGDCVLGKALKDSGTPLTWTWPMFQGGNPSLMNYLEDKQDGSNDLWCAPALSYHHFTPIEVKDLFIFEQDWIRSKTLQVNSTLGTDLQQPLIHHSDVFSSYIMPNMTIERVDWNNTAENLAPGTAGHAIGDCRILCEGKLHCMQYSVGPDGCYLDNEAKLGRRGKGVSSGWIMSRVQQWADKRSECDGKRGWTQPKKEG